MLINLIIIGALFIALCIAIGFFVLKFVAKSATFAVSLFAAIAAIVAFVLVCIGIVLVAAFFIFLI